MIRAKAYARKGHFVLEIKGHAPGPEGVPSVPCAAVSAVTQTAVAGLEVIRKQFNDYIEFEIDYKNEPPENDIN